MAEDTRRRVPGIRGEEQCLPRCRREPGLAPSAVRCHRGVGDRDLESGAVEKSKIAEGEERNCMGCPHTDTLFGHASACFFFILRAWRPREVEATETEPASAGRACRERIGVML